MSSKRKNHGPKPRAAAVAGAGGPSTGTVRATAPALSARRRWVFRMLALLVLPLLVAIFVELGLRLAGYGYPTGFFKRLRIGQEDCLVENDKFGLRFFPPELSRSPAPVVMPAQKAPGTCRIFVLGESAALGDPRPAFGAARYLQALLQERYPATRFEVVCVAVTAINSHAILPIAGECARNQGDAWILYLGNNEMVGPFGAASVFGAQAPPLRFVRLGLALEKTRLGQLLVSLGRNLTKRASNPSRWEGMEMFARSRVAPGDPRKETVYRNFSRNLADILRVGEEAGVPILLNTVAVNLRDCPPFASWSPTNLPAAAQAACDQLVLAGLDAENRTNFSAAATDFAKSLEWNAQRADLHFHLAGALLSLTNLYQARPHFLAACDLDALPFRADSRINAAIRKSAEHSRADRFAFLDAALLLATNAPGGVPGRESFYEHVHLNFDGNYHLGLAWAEQISRLLAAKLQGASRGDWTSQEACERRLGLTDWNRAGVIEEMIRRLGQPPFSSQSDNVRHLAELQDWLGNLRRNMAATEALARAQAVYREALQLAPDDFLLHENYAEFLEATGDLGQAVSEWKVVAARIPHHHLGYFHAGRLMARLGRLPEAQGSLLRAVGLRPDLGEGWLELGKTHAAEGQNEQAWEDYERARFLLPRDCRVYYFAGRLLSKLNRRTEAIAYLREAVMLKPDYWEAIYGLGEELAFDGQDAEARLRFEQVLRLRPHYAMAHLNLGVSWVKARRWDAACREFEEVLRLDPQNPQARQYLEKARAAQTGPAPR